MAATLEPEWSTLGTGETDFLTQLLNTHSCPSDDLQLGTGGGLEHGSSFLHGDYEPTDGHEHLLNYSDNPNLYNYNCYHLNDSRDILATNDDSMTMDFYVGSEKIMGGSVHDMKGDDEMENEDCLINACNENFHDSGLPLQINKASVSTNSKKRCRTSNVQKNERNVNSRKYSKQVSAKKEEENNGGCGRNLQSSSNSSSEEISNFSQGSKGKTRASRGSATDPQSLYARKRRERINERLRILQNLVPNGTKVDISTMLEEAVQYVNFLKLQIKLLSSDDLWMYAPLAHNGMDIELDLKINMLNALRR